MPKTAVKEEPSITELSAIYDRVYNIADRLFKKYNPCKIQIKNNKTKCANKYYKCTHLCCQYWGDRCQHWQNGCTIKCLACKLFICGEIQDNKVYIDLVKHINRLRRITTKCGFSNFDYYITKKIIIKQVRQQARKQRSNKQQLAKLDAGGWAAKKERIRLRGLIEKEKT